MCNFQKSPGEIGCFIAILSPRHSNCVFWDILDNFLSILDGDSVSISNKCEVYGIMSSSFMGEWVFLAQLWV